MTLIYQPSGKANEYAEWALNHYVGCDHGCTYCYVPNVLHTDRQAFHANVRPRFTIEELHRDCQRMNRKDHAGLLETTAPVLRMFVTGEGERVNNKQVLLSFTCDPYCQANEEYGFTRQVIEVLHEYGFSVCTLTKGGLRAMCDAELFTPNDAFATTLTCLNINDSEQYEPGAASPESRIESLMNYHSIGIPTWVSLEPVLSPEDTLRLIEVTAGYVDLFKVGTLNYHPRAKEINWCEFGHKSVELLESLGKRYYIKEDLQKKMEADHA